MHNAVISRPPQSMALIQNPYFRMRSWTARPVSEKIASPASERPAVTPPSIAMFVSPAQIPGGFTGIRRNPIPLAVPATVITSASGGPSPEQSGVANLRHMESALASWGEFNVGDRRDIRADPWRGPGVCGAHPGL